MSFDEHPAAENVRYLRQGIELIGELDDRLWSGPGGTPGQGVGAQFRHCIDFYSCFLGGLSESVIDYNRRDRDRRVEVERDVAIERIEAIAGRLSEIGGERAGDVVEVSLEAVRPDAPESRCRSSVMRELQFLLSHTVHHYALIVTMLKLQGFEVDEKFAEFGVAPSTSIHWKQTGSMTA
jgi:hypothetical protein